MKRYSRAAAIWLVALALCAAAVALSFRYVDTPLAAYVFPFSRHVSGLGEGLGSAVILSLEAATVLALIVLRLVRGKISRLGRVLVLACITSICAYGINSEVFKVIFGIPNPGNVAHGVEHVLHLWMGTRNSSFPSGHMMLAGSFAGVFMRLYPRSVRLLSGLLLIAAILLIVGDWHFLSDVLAGTFIGVSLGLLAGEAWAAHAGRQAG